MKPAPQSHCHCCGTAYPKVDGAPEWPKTCPACGNMQFFNPTPIGVMLQPVTDGNRLGILTPIRGIQPMRGNPAITGGFQEGWDQSSEDAGSREIWEEVGLARPDEDDIDLLCSRATGPFIPGRRQLLVFGVHQKAIPASTFDGWEPNEETLEIHISWKPEVLAFPSHTYALAKYFQRYQGIAAPEAYTRQPRTGDVIDGMPVFNVPYEQPLLDHNIWRVEFEEKGEAYGVAFERGTWARV